MTAADSASAILRDEPPALDLQSDVSPTLTRIVSRCLEKMPERRFQSASDLGFALDGALERESAGSTVALAQTGPRAVGSRALMVAIGVLLLAVALAVGFAFGVRGRSG